MLADHAAAPAERAALYEQALSFYRGDPLLDCYEDWCLIDVNACKRTCAR